MKKNALLLLSLILVIACNSQYSGDETKEEFFCSGACSKMCNIMVGSSGQILKNINGSLTWEKVKSPTDKHLIDAYYDANRNRFYVAGHHGTVAFSDDNGITWQSRNANPKYHFFGIAANNNKLMVVGKSLVLLSSKDGGFNWEILRSGVPQLSFYDIAFGNGVWIAVGNYSNVLVVNDITGNITDTRAETSKKRTLKSIVFGNSSWVAVGHEGVIFVSKDNGTNWTKKNSETTEDLLSVAFNGKRFVTVGTNGIILTSKDGSLWKKVQINNNSTFRSISCTDAHWLAITIDGKKEIIEDSKIE